MFLIICGIVLQQKISSPARTRTNAPIQLCNTYKFQGIVRSSTRKINNGEKIPIVNHQAFRTKCGA